MNKRTNTAQWEEKYQRWRIAVQKDGVRKQFYSSTPGRTGQREANAKADAWLENDIAVKAGRVENVYQLWIEDLKLTTSTGNWKPVESRWAHGLRRSSAKRRSTPLQTGTCKPSSTRPRRREEPQNLAADCQRSPGILQILPQSKALHLPAGGCTDTRQRPLQGQERVAACRSGKAVQH